MIGKVFLTGKTFGETCQYVCRKESQSQVLAAEGVRAHDHRLMAADFEWQHRLMPDKEKPVFHSVLSFPPGEWIEDQLLVDISKEYLRRIGMVDTQYALVKHSDKEHLHVHIVANRVDNDGAPIGKGLIIERAIKAAEQLTKDYGLREEHGKRLERTNLEALREPDAKRYRIYTAIREHLPQCHSMGELEKRLSDQGIEMRYRVDPESDKVQGISFRLENQSFKGSAIDGAFSFKGLERILALQERQTLEASLEKLVKGRLVSWDEEGSIRRRQELKDSVEKKEERRVTPKVKEEEQVEEQVQRRGIRMRM